MKHEGLHTQVLINGNMRNISLQQSNFNLDRNPSDKLQLINY